MGKYDALMAAYKKERQSRGVEAMPSPLKGMLSTANAATLGLGGQLYALGGGAIEAATGGEFSEGYQQGRDTIKGIERSYEAEYPNLSLATNLAASLPATTFNPLPLKTSSLALTGLQKTGRALANTGRAAGTAAVYGGISGAGNSDAYDLQGIANDAQREAATSALLTAVAHPIFSGAGAVANNLYQRTALGQGGLSGYSNAIGNVLGGGAKNIYDKTLGANSAGNFADLKVAEALARSAEGKTFKAKPEAAQALINNAGNRASTRIGKLPEGTPLAVAGGESTLDLLDIAAISAGATKQAVKDKQHILTGKESERVVSSAAKALGTGRPDYNETIEGFTQAAKIKAAPYYTQLQGVSLPVDDSLRSILGRAEPFFAGSNLRSKIDNVGGATLKEALNPTATSVHLSRLDVLKQTLYDMEEAAKISGKKGLSKSISNLRNELTNKLDDLSPKTQQGDSIYKLARDAYGGEMQLKNAVENGRLIFREDAMNIRDSLKNMTQSEKDAFRLGAYQAIYDKAGRGAGRSELMNIYKDHAIADRLKAVFGNDYRKFASKLAAEFELKKFQRVAGGSQTAGRQQGLNDLELSPLRDASEGVGALASGSVRGSVNPLSKLWQGISVPESVRTNMAKTLLLEGAPAQAKLQGLNDLVQYINQQKQINAMRFGSTFGQLQGGNQ